MKFEEWWRLTGKKCSVSEPAPTWERQKMGRRWMQGVFSPKRKMSTKLPGEYNVGQKNYDQPIQLCRWYWSSGEASHVASMQGKRKDLFWKDGSRRGSDPLPTRLVPIRISAVIIYPFRRYVDIVMPSFSWGLSFSQSPFSHHCSLFLFSVLTPLKAYPCLTGCPWMAFLPNLVLYNNILLISLNTYFNCLGIHINMFWSNSHFLNYIEITIDLFKCLLYFKRQNSSC